MASMLTYLLSLTATLPATLPSEALSHPVLFPSATPSFAIAPGGTSTFSASLTFYASEPTNTAVYTAAATIPVGIAAATPSAAANSSSTVSGSSSTNTSSTSATSSTSTVNPSSISSVPASANGYSAGSLAGAAVGCAIGGILLGCLIGFFLFRRRGYRSRNTRSHGIDKELSPSQEHGEAILLGSGPKAAWMSHLPQSDSDSTIRAATSRILDQIEMHVENFYVDKNIGHMNIEMQSAIEDFDSRHLPESILAMLPRTDRSTLLLKHCLANLILAHIDAQNDGSSSFLPRDLTSLKMSSTKTTAPGYGQALSQWRVLSRFLRQEPEHDQAYLTERDRAIFTTAQNFCRAFEPWARSDENARLQSLVGIMKRASELGILLFSQPASFHWQWEIAAAPKTGPGARKGGSQFVVLPGLYKTTDREGVSLVSPLHLIEPQIGSTSGQQG